MVTRRTKYSWMALGGLLCLFGVVFICKVRDGNRLAAQTEAPPADSTKPDPTRCPPAVHVQGGIALPPLDTRPAAPRDAVGEPALLSGGTPLPPLPPGALPPVPSKLVSPPVLSSSAIVPAGGTPPPPAEAPPVPGFPPPMAGPLSTPPPHPALPSAAPPQAPLGSDPRPIMIPASGAGAPAAVPAPAIVPVTPPSPPFAPEPPLGPVPPPASRPAPEPLSAPQPPAPPAPAPAAVAPTPPPTADAAVIPARAETVLPVQPPVPTPAVAAGAVVNYPVRQAGETIRTIARRTLGSSERWSDVQKLNPMLPSETALPLGTVVHLPADATLPDEDTLKPLPSLRNRPPFKAKAALPLTGTFPILLDDHKVMTLPAHLREQLGNCEQVLISPGPDRCLWLTNQAHLERLTNRLENSPAREADLRVFKRLYYAQTVKVPMKDGRVVISDRLAQFAGLGQEIVLVGIDDHFEVWDAARWRRYTQTKKAIPGDAE